MDLETYINKLGRQRQGNSFAFLAERCKTSADAPYRIRPAERISAEENCVLVLAGTGGTGINIRGYNSMLKKVDGFIKSHADFVSEKVRTCVAVCDFGKFHADKTAREALYYESVAPERLPQLKYNLPEHFWAETFNPEYIKDIFNTAVLPRIAGDEGRVRLNQTEAKQNIRRLNIVAHCHGGYVAMKLEQLMNAKMTELGYAPEEQKELKSQFFVLCYNPDCPKNDSELKFISIESAKDGHNKYNNYLKEWLLMSNRDFGVCYLPKKWGRTLMCAQVDKAGIEGNSAQEIQLISVEEWFDGLRNTKQKKTLGEHDFMGFIPKDNMSRGAMKLQSFANNILKNAVRNSLQQGKEAWVPLSNIQNLAADNLQQKFDFAKAVINGFKLELEMEGTNKNKIDEFANYRKSIKTVELD